MNESICVVLITYRDNFQAYITIVNTLESALHLNITFLIACGNTNPEHMVKILSLVEHYKSRGTDVRVIFEESIPLRLKWAVRNEHQWFIMLSDDDPFTTNYIGNYVKKIRDQSVDLRHVSNITPKVYGLTGKDSLDFFYPNSLTSIDPIGRIVSLLSSSNIGVRYYSAFRAEAVRKVFAERIFFPSYVDQLICLEAAKLGKSISFDGDGTVFYDLSNWLTPRQCLVSDLKHYKSPISIFFHEAYWLRDCLESISELVLSLEGFSFIKAYSTTRLSNSLQNFPIRSAHLKEIGDLDAEIETKIFTRLIEIYQGIAKSHSFKELSENLKPPISAIERLDHY